MGQVAEHPHGLLLGVTDHEVLQRHRGSIQKFLLIDLLSHIGIIGIGLNLRKGGRHGEIGQNYRQADQHKTHQYKVGRRLLRAHSRTQKGKGDDISGEGRHHHQERRQKRNHRGQKQDLKHLYAVAVDIDQSLW